MARNKPPQLDAIGIGNVLQQYITKNNWSSALVAGHTLFHGVTTFYNLKVEKQHIYHNRELLKALLEMNATGAFNKSTIANVLEALNIQGAMKQKHGPNWGMQHGWFIIQCMAYLRKRSREFTPKTEPCLVDLINDLEEA